MTSTTRAAAIAAAGTATATSAAIAATIPFAMSGKGIDLVLVRKNGGSRCGSAGSRFCDRGRRTGRRRCAWLRLSLFGCWCRQPIGHRHGSRRHGCFRHGCFRHGGINKEWFVERICWGRILERQRIEGSIQSRSFLLFDLRWSFESTAGLLVSHRHAPRAGRSGIASRAAPR